MQTIVLVAVGYFSALVSQPLASPLSHLIHWLVAGRKRYYVESIGKKLTPHEQIVPRFGFEQELCLTFIAAIVLLVLAVITAFRRKWRADRGLKLSKNEG